MGDKTGIEWTDATWNPVVGCSVISPGCTNCYAMKMAARIERMTPGTHYAGTTRASKAGAVWTGKMALAPDHLLILPLRWRKPRRIFVNSMGDLFHEAVPDAWIDRVFAVMALAPQHTFQVLTKRSARMRAYMEALICKEGFRQYVRRPGWKSNYPRDADRVLLLGEGQSWPLRNVWLGVSAEDQRRADERIPDLLATPAAVRFVSAEPLLGPIDLRKWLSEAYECSAECGFRSAEAPPREVCHACGLTSKNFGEFCECGSQDFGALCPECESDAVKNHPDTPNIDWIIVGGESGPGARPMHPNWARSLRDQCAAAGVPFHFKQHGEWLGYGAGALPDEMGSLGLPCEPRGDHDFGDGTMVFRVGKKAAGRLLDGIEHNGMPELARQG